MNFSLDDSSSPPLSYSGNWAIQSPSDPDLSRFFQGTYHVAQANGATMNLTFQGSAIAIYGSKGPGHGNYSVQFDDAIAFFSAYADQTQFQQPLFQHTSSNPSAPAEHFVSFEARFDAAAAQNPWLDVDFVTFTDGSENASATGVVTVPPPWESGTSTASTSTSSSSATPAADASSPSSKAPTVLAAVFGSLLGVALLLVLAYFVLRRLYDTQRARDHAFRYGQAPATPKSSARFSESIRGREPARARVALLNGSVTSVASQSHPHAVLRTGGVAYAQVPVRSPPPGGSFASQPQPDPGEVLPADEGREGGRDAREGVGVGVGVRAAATAPSAAGTFLSSSPILFKKVHRGDADSLRTDFLQV
ncbi:hypothetical protein AcW1_005182 [Taiwanofungus camphoratus]|nr:hypothetical protein AcW2_003954 [Antrodia cinnamomea]KAI0956526.1 hypothetical protein AcW1_005182 [Antrodia cinnamomea]